MGATYAPTENTQFTMEIYQNARRSQGISIWDLNGIPQKRSFVLNEYASLAGQSAIVSMSNFGNNDPCFNVAAQFGNSDPAANWGVLLHLYDQDDPITRAGSPDPPAPLFSSIPNTADGTPYKYVTLDIEETTGNGGEFALGFTEFTQASEIGQAPNESWISQRVSLVGGRKTVTFGMSPESLTRDPYGPTGDHIPDLTKLWTVNLYIYRNGTATHHAVRIGQVSFSSTDPTRPTIASHSIELTDPATGAVSVNVLARDEGGMVTPPTLTFQSPNGTSTLQFVKSVKSVTSWGRFDGTRFFYKGIIPAANQVQLDTSFAGQSVDNQVVSGYDPNLLLPLATATKEDASTVAVTANYATTKIRLENQAVDATVTAKATTLSLDTLNGNPALAFHTAFPATGDGSDWGYMATLIPTTASAPYFNLTGRNQISFSAQSDDGEPIEIALAIKEHHPEDPQRNETWVSQRMLVPSTARQYSVGLNQDALSLSQYDPAADRILQSNLVKEAYIMVFRRSTTGNRVLRVGDFTFDTDTSAPTLAINTAEISALRPGVVTFNVTASDEGGIASTQTPTATLVPQFGSEIPLTLSISTPNTDPYGRFTGTTFAFKGALPLNATALGNLRLVMSPVSNRAGLITSIDQPIALKYGDWTHRPLPTPTGPTVPTQQTDPIPAPSQIAVSPPQFVVFTLNNGSGTSPTAKATTMTVTPSGSAMNVTLTTDFLETKDTNNWGFQVFVQNEILSLPIADGLKVLRFAASTETESNAPIEIAISIKEFNPAHPELEEIWVSQRMRLSTTPKNFTVGLNPDALVITPFDTLDNNTPETHRIRTLSINVFRGTATGPQTIKISNLFAGAAISPTPSVTYAPTDTTELVPGTTTFNVLVFDESGVSTNSKPTAFLKGTQGTSIPLTLISAAKSVDVHGRFDGTRFTFRGELPSTMVETEGLTLEVSPIANTFHNAVGLSTPISFDPSAITLAPTMGNVHIGNQGNAITQETGNLKIALRDPVAALADGNWGDGVMIPMSKRDARLIANGYTNLATVAQATGPFRVTGRLAVSEKSGEVWIGPDVELDYRPQWLSLDLASPTLRLYSGLGANIGNGKLDPSDIAFIKVEFVRLPDAAADWTHIPVSLRSDGPSFAKFSPQRAAKLTDWFNNRPFSTAPPTTAQAPSTVINSAPIFLTKSHLASPPVPTVNRRVITTKEDTVLISGATAPELGTLTATLVSFLGTATASSEPRTISTLTVSRKANHPALWSLTAPASSDESHFVVLSLLGKNGSSSLNQPILINRDITAPPQPSLSTPTHRTTSNSVIPIAGQIDASDISSINVTVLASNGQTLFAEQASLRSRDFGLIVTLNAVAGTYTIKVNASDTVGNWGPAALSTVILTNINSSITPDNAVVKSFAAPILVRMPPVVREILTAPTVTLVPIDSIDAPNMTPDGKLTVAADHFIEVTLPGGLAPGESADISVPYPIISPAGVKILRMHAYYLDPTTHTWVKTGVTKERNERLSVGALKDIRYLTFTTSHFSKFGVFTSSDHTPPKINAFKINGKDIVTKALVDEDYVLPKGTISIDLSDNGLGDTGVATYNLRITDAKGVERKSKNKTYPNAATVTDSLTDWYLDEGANRLVLTVTDFAGNTASKAVTLNVSTKLTILNPLNVPNPFNANLEKTQLQYTLTMPANVDISIYTIGHEKVARFHFSDTEEGGKAGFNSIEWDGRDLRGNVLANGIYVAYVLAKKDSQKAVTHIKLAVLK